MSAIASPEHNKGVGERLGALRAAHGLNQTQMADALDVVLRAYQNYERGEREIPSTLILRLVNRFDADPVWVLEGPGLIPKRLSMRTNFELLEEVIEAIEAWQIARKVKLEPAKKSRLIRTLFQHFLKQGAIDVEHLTNTMSLVA